MTPMYLSEEGVWSDDLYPVTEEPKLVLIDSVFHHPVSLARLGCLPNGVTQTFVSEVFEPSEIIPFSG